MARTKVKARPKAKQPVVATPSPPPGEVDELATPSPNAKSEAEAELTSAKPITDAEEVLPSSQPPTSSSTSTASSSSTMPLPDKVILRLAHILSSVDLLGTLASLSSASKSIRKSISPILFDTIIIRNHRQLSAILSHFDTPPPDPKKRRTRVSGFKCDTQAKLACFGMTRHLSINHFPSLENLTRLSVLKDTFSESPIFSGVETLHLAPILLHHLHPSAYGKVAALTAKRTKELNLLGILARPAKVTIDMRGAEEEWVAKPSAETPHGCTCVDDLSKRLEEIWGKGNACRELSIDIDFDILSTHFFSTSAAGPALTLVVAPHPQSEPDPSSPPPTKRSRRSKSTTPMGDNIALKALSTYILHRVRHASEHKGGKMSILLPPQVDLDALVSGMMDGAKELAEEGEEGLFTAIKARLMLKAITVESGDGLDQNE